MSVEVLLTWQSKRSSGGLVGPGGGPVDTMEVRSDPVEVWSDPMEVRSDPMEVRSDLIEVRLD